MHLTHDVKMCLHCDWPGRDAETLVHPQGQTKASFDIAAVWCRHKADASLMSEGAASVPFMLMVSGHCFIKQRGQ